MSNSNNESINKKIDNSLSEKGIKEVEEFELTTNKNIAKMTNREKLRLYTDIKAKYMADFFSYLFTSACIFFTLISVCNAIGSSFNMYESSFTSIDYIILSIMFIMCLILIYIRNIYKVLKKNAIANEINNLHKSKPCE